MKIPLVSHYLNFSLIQGVWDSLAFSFKKFLIARVTLLTAFLSYFSVVACIFFILTSPVGHFTKK